MGDNGKSNGRAVYAVFRTGNLGQALVSFRDRFDADPVAVVVNAQLVDEMAAALISVGLDVPVATSGGCLLGELWLQRDITSAVDCQRAAVALRSLTARVSAAQRTGEPMAKERARQLVLEMEVER